MPLLDEFDTVDGGDPKQWHTFRKQLRTRFHALVRDTLAAFMIFYVSFLQERLDHTPQNDHIFLFFILLGFVHLELHYGVRARAYLQFTTLSILIILSEWYAFVAQTGILFTVRLALERLRTWSLLTGHVGHMIFAVVYLTLILLAIAYYYTSHTEWIMRMHSVIDKIAFGLALFIAATILPTGHSFGPLTTMIILLVLVAMSHLLGYTPDLISHFTAIELGRDAKWMVRWTLITNKFVDIVVRVLVFLLARSLLNSLTHYLRYHFESTTRVIAPIAILFIFGAYAQTQYRVHTTEMLTPRIKRLLRDILQGLNIFVSQFIVTHVQGDVPLVFTTLLVAFAFVPVLLSAELWFEHVAHKIVRSDEGAYGAIRTWIDIVNRLLLFTLIQLLLREIQPAFRRTGEFDAYYHLFLPLTYTLTVFFIFPDFAQTQDETYADEQRMVKQEQAPKAIDSLKHDAKKQSRSPGVGLQHYFWHQVTDAGAQGVTV